MMRTRHFAWIAAAALVAACDSPLDTNPTAAIDAGEALSTPRGVELAVNGAYRSLQPGSLFGNTEMVYPDLYTDNLDFTGTFQTDREVSLRQIASTNTAVRDIWRASYSGINRSNNILAAIPNVGALTPTQRSVYRGEALFIRSLHYLVLTRYFGDVPILTTPSSGVGPESQVPRQPQTQVYARIMEDLNEAITLLPAGRVDGRATVGAAQALLARVCLEAANYTCARDMATAVIGNTEYSLVADYRSIFTVKNTTESIFELQYSINNSNSLAFWYFPVALGGRLGFAPSEDLFNAYEPGDERRDASIAINQGQRYGIKYHRIALGDDNVVILRLAEMYLIRAEANTRLGADAATVRADIDVVRNRAGLANLPVTVATQPDLIDAIAQERRVEFAMEGHRFYDLRRLGLAQPLLGLTPEQLLWPIPQSERDVNPNLTQNQGY